MQVVIDTNVLVSGLLGLYSYPARIIDLLYIDRLTCVYDDRIMSEYADVLSRPKFASVISAKERNDLLGYIAQTGLYILAVPIEEFVFEAPDKDDIPFAEVAVTGNAEYIITGNYSHFSFFVYNHWGIKIASPRTFYNVFCSGKNF